MSLQEAVNLDDNRVLSFHQWCELNGFSPATGRRIINAGNGPIITQLSPRRIGVTVANNDEAVTQHADPPDLKDPHSIKWRLSYAVSQFCGVQIFRSRRQTGLR